VALQLSPGEQVVYEGHPSWRSIIAFYIKGIAVTLVAALVVGLVTKVTGDGVDSGLVSIIAVAGIAITLLAGFIRRVATRYTITNRRLHIKRGIVSREVQETRLERVQNVNYHQGVLQRVLQVGDVDFDTAGTDDSNFIFVGVSQPEKVVEDVGEATRLAGGHAGLGDEAGQPVQPPPQV
jgi:uncharacterized membrane protein YdbT with pleckstrin-like domain